MRRTIRRMRRAIPLLFLFSVGFLAGAFFVLRQVRALAADAGERSFFYDRAAAAGTGAGVRRETGSEGEVSEGEAYERLLINAEHPLEDYVPELVEVEDGYMLDAPAAEALKEMLQAGRAEGYALKICSAYRTHEKQTQLFSNKTAQYTAKGLARAEAEAQAARTVARPGTSEHESGLAADLVSESYQLLDEGQERTAEQQWLMENCSRFGFILRYPQDKTEITGIIYEPWHYRYVGVEMAEEITEKGICLEEAILALQTSAD